MKTKSRQLRRGFTLVELMVAMTAGSFAIAGVYYIGSMSSRAYSEQMRVSDLQMAVRTSIEQLRRDFGRAGFLGSRNVNSLTEHLPCDGDPGSVADGAQIQGIEVVPHGSETGSVRSLLNDGENLTRADIVRLWGNYATSDAYMVNGPGSTDSSFSFQTTHESFRRSFVDPGVGGNPPTYNEDRFRDAFTNRWVRVESNGRYWFRQVQSVNLGAAANPTDDTIIVTPPLPGVGCFTMVGVVVSPLSRVAYLLDTVERGGPLGRLDVGDAPGAERAVLVRREENIRDGVPIEASTRVVLDYAVEFSVDGIINTALAGVVPTFEYATDRSANTVDVVSTNTPEQFRSVLVTLSARTLDANPRLPKFDRATLDDPLRIFNVAVPGAPPDSFRATVRSLRAELFLPNMMAAPR